MKKMFLLILLLTASYQHIYGMKKNGIIHPQPGVDKKFWKINILAFFWEKQGDKLFVYDEETLRKLVYTCKTLNNIVFAEKPILQLEPKNSKNKHFFNKLNKEQTYDKNTLPNIVFIIHIANVTPYCPNLKILKKNNVKHIEIGKKEIQHTFMYVDTIENIGEILPNLHSLTLRSCKTTSIQTYKNLFNCLPKMRRLIFTGKTWLKDTFKNFNGKHKNLTHLKIEYNDDSTRDPMNPGINKLQCSISELQKFPNLKVASIPFCLFTSSNVEKMGSHNKIEELFISVEFSIPNFVGQLPFILTFGNNYVNKIQNKMQTYNNTTSLLHSFRQAMEASTSFQKTVQEKNPKRQEDFTNMLSALHKNMPKLKTVTLQLQYPVNKEDKTTQKIGWKLVDVKFKKYANNEKRYIYYLTRISLLKSLS
jgi:hypothetical protein